MANVIVRIASTIGSDRNELTINQAKDPSLSTVTGTIYDAENATKTLLVTQTNGRRKRVQEDISDDLIGTTLTVMFPTTEVGRIQEAAKSQKDKTGKLIGLVFELAEVDMPQQSFTKDGKVSFNGVSNTYISFVDVEKGKVISTMETMVESFDNAVTHTEAKAKEVKLNWWERGLEKLGVTGQGTNPAKEIANSLNR